MQGDGGADDDLLRVLRDPLLWESPLFQSVDEAGSVFAAMDAEDAAAALLCDAILTGSSTAWPERLRETPGVRTAGMVRQLLDRMPRLAESRPAAALQVTSMALAIADVLDPEEYGHDHVAYLRGQAMRDQASVLSFMGRYAEALRYVASAEGVFEELAELAEWDMARLRIVKAAALGLQSRSEEAVALAHEAGERFLELDDRPRFVNARIVEAAMLYDGGAVERALEVWRSVEGDRDLDPIGALRVTHNIALCLCDLGRGEEAIAPLKHCLSEFAARGLLTERTRSRWHLGNALLGTVQNRKAINTLRLAWREFAELGLMVDAALAALDLAEALVANEEPAQVPAICHEVIAQLTKDGLAMQAIPALSLLREAAVLGGASRAFIRETHATVMHVGREEARLSAGRSERAQRATM